MEKDEQLLWEKYKKDKNLENRNALVSYYTEMATKFAAKFHTNLTNSKVDADDVLSWGIIGLIQAVENYDNNKCTQFSTYAYTRMRGSILDNLHELGVLPKHIIRKLNNLQNMRQTFIAKNGRKPTNAELAKALKVSVKNLDELVMLERDAREEVHNTETVELLGNIECLDIAEVKEMIFKALNHLSETDYKIFKCIYLEHKNLKETGKALHFTGSYISQRNAFILNTIKEICNARCGSC